MNAWHRRLVRGGAPFIPKLECDINRCNTESQGCACLGLEYPAAQVVDALTGSPSHGHDGEVTAHLARLRLQLGHEPGRASVERAQALLEPWGRHTYVFVGGLHHSGTGIFAQLLASHRGVSGFTRDRSGGHGGTGAVEDEGVWMQAVLPSATCASHVRSSGCSLESMHHVTLGGPVGEELLKRQRGVLGLVLGQWARYWDTSAQYLLEKSPENSLRMPFLDRLLPTGAPRAFVVVLRHPCATSGVKWPSHVLTGLMRCSGAPGESYEQLGAAGKRACLDPSSRERYLEAYLAASERALSDAASLPSGARVAFVRYEALVADPAGTVRRTCEKLGLEGCSGPARGSRRLLNLHGRDLDASVAWQRLEAAPQGELGETLKALGRLAGTPLGERVRRLGYVLSADLEELKRPLAADAVEAKWPGALVV